MSQPVGNMRGMTDHVGAPSPTRQFAPLAIMLSIPLLFAAIFFYTSPVVLETGGQQGIFKCGSPSSPNGDAKNICSEPERIERNKALYSGLSGATLLGLGAVWLLRGHSRDDEDWDDEGTRGRRDEEIDLRTEPRGETARRDGLRSGVGSRRERRAEATEEGRRSGQERDIGGAADEPSAPRDTSTGRRSVLRDDDFGDPQPRRRADDDWSSDGWR